MKLQSNIYWIDLFCGAGGTSTGIHLAGCQVIACVNHDEDALAAHELNHPDAKHFEEDIRDRNVVLKLRKLTDEIRAKDPFAVVCIWASLECTNFSNAKGGLPRDADSRTLADHMEMYIEILSPEYFWVENVREFMSWGPLDENRKPESKTAGRDFIRWINLIKSYGYREDHQILNAANFGAYQSRERLFMQFPLKDFPIAWPQQTHTKDKKVSYLFPMERWKPVRDVLDLNDHGHSIFDRKKQLCENTLKRILAGLEKFVGKDHFISKYYSGKPEHKNISVDGPAGTVKTIDGQAIVSPAFLQTYYKSGSVYSPENPSPTISTKDRVAKVDVHFIDQQYGKSKPITVDLPLNTITGNPKFALVNPQFVMNQYSGGGESSGIDSVSGTITGVPKQNLISCNWIMDTNFNNIGRSIDEPASTLVASRRHPYLINANSSTDSPKNLESPCPSVTTRTHLLVNPSWFGHSSSVDEPCCTIIARQDKSPLYIVAAEHGNVAWLVFEDDSETMVKIKSFMVLHGIVDIKMRMLKVSELLQIQGFPKDYKLHGNQTKQKKQIGNAVEVNQAKALINSNRIAVENYWTDKKMIA